MKWSLISISIVVFFACENHQIENIQGEWIRGTEKEKIKIIEHQFRGFDMAMVEVGYRYQELFWAGQDKNWEYAQYQLSKIQCAIQNGLERRPKRTKSAAHFLTVTLPEMEKAIAAKDTLVYDENFAMLTNNCNACHAQEKVAFFKVETPTNRISPIH